MRRTRALSICATVAAALGLGGCVAPYYGTVKVGFVDDRPAYITGNHGTEYQTATYTIDKGGLIANVQGTASLIYDFPEGVVTSYGCTYYRSRTYGTGNTLGTIAVTEAPDHSTARVSLRTWPPVSYANTPTYPNFKDITPCGIFPEANVIFLTRFADGEPGHPGPETLDFGRQIDGSWVGAKSYDCSPSFLLKVTCFVDYELHPQAQVASSLK